MQTRRLGKTGLQLPILSFGASSLGGVFREVDEQEGIRAWSADFFLHHLGRMIDDAEDRTRGAAIP